jgi:hypothetical protein
MTIFPCVGSLISPMAVSSVVLPEPEGPRMATSSPGLTLNVAPEMARTAVSPRP